MFHTRETSWWQATDGNSWFPELDPLRVVVDERNGERRLGTQSPIPGENRFLHFTENTNEEESDGYGTPDEDGDVVDEELPTTDENSEQERKMFTTPCGQTYWVGEGYRLYTNEHVDMPIGYWCPYDQCVYLNDDMDSDNDDDDDEPPPTPPPLYEARDNCSPQNTIVTVGVNDDEVEGETIVITPQENAN
tara:strand:+ start:581 stop:1153 length:573 start_codon:yes stop_codon:yes gene_type:complete